MEYKEEYLCGSERLEKLIDTNGLLFALSFITFFVALFTWASYIFFLCFIGFFISFFAFEVINPTSEDDKTILESFIKATKISKNILFCFLLIAVLLRCYVSPKISFSLKSIPEYVFFILNVMRFFNFKSINRVSRDVLENLEYKTKVKEDIDNISFRVTETLSIIEHMFDGLEYDEKDILRPCVLKLQELFMLSYDTLYNIKNPNMFYDIERFILRYAKTIQAYRKGKGSSDLDFLERLNNSAEELYFTLNSKEQALRKDNFENKMDILKIKLNQVY